MAWHLAIFHLGRANVNADQVGYLTTAIHPARTWAAVGFALSQTDDQLLARAMASPVGGGFGNNNNMLSPEAVEGVADMLERNKQEDEAAHSVVHQV